MIFDKPNKNSDITSLKPPDAGQLDNPVELQSINKDLVHPAERGQVRKIFNGTTILELRESIRCVGQIEPITVERDPNGNGFIVVTGERRLRAIQCIDELNEVICIVREFSNETERYALQLAENFDREDLSIIDKALAIEKLIEMHDGDISKAGETIGKHRTTLIKMRNVLNLSEKAKKFVKDGFCNDYSAISALKTLCRIDEKSVFHLIECYRRGENDRPMREALRTEIDRLSTKKTKSQRQKISRITANEIYMKNDDKIIVISRIGVTSIKLEKPDDNLRQNLFSLLKEM